jgi:hypothetical protein
MISRRPLLSSIYFQLNSISFFLDNISSRIVIIFYSKWKRTIIAVKTRQPALVHLDSLLQPKEFNYISSA